MDELIGLLTSKVGISADQAKQITGIFGGFLKDKLPPDVMKSIGDIPGLGDLFGGVSDAAGAATDTAAGAAGAATGAAAGAAGAATDTAGSITDTIKGLFGKS